MKIIFNSYIRDWYWQIFDELSKNYEIVLPDNYKDESNKSRIVDLENLEKCVRENMDADFIFDLRGSMHHLIEWTNRKIDLPLVLFDTNVINRPYKAKRSLFAYLWYVEKYAKPLMEKYNKENLIYQGMAANPYLYYPIETEKIYDIGFFGQHYGERKYWLDIIKDFCEKNKIMYSFPKGHGEKLPWSFEDINTFYNQCKINISFSPKQTLGRIVNLRTFEINMSGNFQLMQYTPLIEEYFEVDEEIVTWKNKNELFEKIQYYLKNETEREKIAKNGYKRAIENHTWSKRIEHVYTFLKEKKNLSIEKFKINIEDVLDKKDGRNFKKIQINNKRENTSNIVLFILKNKGYKLKRDIKNINQIKIVNFRQNITTYYYPSLSNFYFLGLRGKIMMVLKIIKKSDIKYEDWNEFRKVFCLIENIDQDMAQFGILTNGNEWIIQDQKEKKWLKEIPRRKALKARVNFIEIIKLKIKKILQDLNKKFKILKFISFF